MSKHFFSSTVLILAVFLIDIHLTTQTFAQESAFEKLDGAIERATQVIDKGVANYPEHRSCFSCHHQALPLLSNSIGNVHHQQSQQSFYDRQQTRDVLAFTDRAFASKKSTLNSGGEIGGRALTVAYGLWAMDLAGAPESEITQAMVEYLLKTQADDGAWNFQSLRPPAASSRAMTSAVAVYGLRSYADGMDNDPRVRSAYQRALDWSNSLNEPGSHEELVGQTWLEHMLHEELGIDKLHREQMMQAKLWNSQREDGGWAQTSDLTSDAYATGQSLTLLAEVFFLMKKPLHTNGAYQRGIQFLLETQQPDGSWLVKTRSKPVQVFFDNGDPHGQNQFISMMATSWATAALKVYQHQTYQPLSSPRVQARIADRQK